jgi:methionyl-tRNA formyltransferase
VPSYIIASRVPWHRDLARRLSERTGRHFTLATTTVELDLALAEQPDVRFVFFTHWSARISQAVWSRVESVIFHMTDLPYGRGGSPLQNLILRGHKETKISALRCVEALDAGPIYAKQPLSLSGSADEIFRRATGVIEDMIVDIVTHEPTPVEQQGEPTQFRRRLPEESVLTWDMTLDRVYDHIRMLDADGYPAAFLDLGQLRLEFTRVTRSPGTLEARVTIRFNDRISE